MAPDTTATIRDELSELERAYHAAEWHASTGIETAPPLPAIAYLRTACARLDELRDTAAGLKSLLEGRIAELERTP